MTANGVLQMVLYVIVLLLLAEPLGAYMAAVYEGRRTWLERLFGPLERFFYRLAGVDASREQSWQAYTLGVLLFSGALPADPGRLQFLDRFLPLGVFEASHFLGSVVGVALLFIALNLRRAPGRA